MNLLCRACRTGLLPALLVGFSLSAAAAPLVDTAAAAAVPGASAPGPADPLEHLRRRLAEKLGAEPKPPVAGKAAPMVRIVNRGEDEPQASRPRTAKAVASAATPRPAGPASASASAGAAPWSHAGPRGPAAWAELDPAHALCANGLRQSPIDIRDGFALDLEPVQFHYQPSRAAVVDTGHTVRVDMAPGNAIVLSGRRYELVEFHFHRPSEEAIDGRRSEMVVHLLHRDAAGSQAMVAVLLERGAAQPLIQAVWNDLPLEREQAQPVRDPLDPSALLPATRDYYTYMGSRTTPPCSEGVLWIVLKTPLQLSAEQLAIFARLYPMNARPLQPANGRMVKQSR